MRTGWYWCLTHQRPEEAEHIDDPDNCLGPYESADEARNWKEKHESRSQTWADEDDHWENGEEEI